MNYLLAAISGQGVVSALIWLVIIGTVFWLLWWLLSYLNPPEPFKKIGTVILAIAAVIFLINLLLSLAGKPLISWP